MELALVPASNVWLALVAFALLAWPEDTSRKRLKHLGLVPASLTSRTSGGVGKHGLFMLLFALAVVTFGLGVEVSLAAVLLVWTLVRVVRVAKQRSQQWNQTTEIMRATETICAELRAGADPARALRRAHRELVQRRQDHGQAAGSRAFKQHGRIGVSVATEFERAADRSVFAAPWAEYLQNEHNEDAIGRDTHPDLDRLARAWQSAQSCGLPMADIIDRCRGDIAARIAFRSRSSAALAGPRMTILVLASLPAIGLLLGQAFGAAPLEFLGGGGVGAMVLVIGTLLTCAGVLWATHILTVAEAGA